MSYPLYYALRRRRRRRRAPAPRTRRSTPYGPFTDRRRQDGDAGAAERARVGECSAAKVLGNGRNWRVIHASASSSRSAPRQSPGRSRRVDRRQSLRSLTSEQLIAPARRRADRQRAHERRWHEVWEHPQLRARGRWMRGRRRRPARSRRCCRRARSDAFSAAHGRGTRARAAHAMRSSANSAGTRRRSSACARRERSERCRFSDPTERGEWRR
jgi:hypothetical protein